VVVLTLVQFSDNRPQEAILNLPEALKLLKRHESNGPLPLAMKAHLEGRLARATGQNELAARRYAESVRLVEQSLGGTHFLVGHARKHLAIHYHEALNNLEAAEREFHASLRVSDHSGGPRSNASASTRMFLARVLRDRKRFAEAEALLRETCEVMRAGHHESLGRCLHILAEVCCLQGKRREALPFLREAVRERQRIGDWLWYSHTASNLAHQLTHFGQVEDAVTALGDANRHLSRQPALPADASWALACRCAEQAQLLIRLGGREAEVEEAAGLAADAVRAAAEGLGKPVRDLAADEALSVFRGRAAFRPLLAVER
jgi:tetratricopeptide (TPR) repeat protein